MTAEIIPFNPLDIKNLGASIAEAMLAGKVHSLGKIPEFSGAGIYAIYYQGGFAAYNEITKRNKDVKTAPIYVGKAIPAGARKGGGKGAGGLRGKTLSNRLAEHAESIRAVSNLDIADFSCRFLVLLKELE